MDETFFSRREIIMRLLPVKSSLPARMTMARPAGKTQVPASLPATELARVEPTPARAIKMPARMARRKRRGRGVLDLLTPDSTKA